MFGIIFPLVVGMKALNLMSIIFSLIWFIRLRRRPRLRAVTHFGVQARPWLWRNAELRIGILPAIDLPCFGGFRSPADDPPKPLACQRTCSASRWRRWVGFLGTTPACRNALLRAGTGLPVGLHLYSYFIRQ
jgi:hypothetical protein